MSSIIDTNISNYTLSELIAISEISDFNYEEINEKTNKLIDKFKYSNPNLSFFFVKYKVNYYII